jgi:hypothetical protein
MRSLVCQSRFRLLEPFDLFVEPLPRRDGNIQGDCRSYTSPNIRWGLTSQAIKAGGGD